MTPEQAADKAAALLDDASKHLHDTVHVHSCVAVADAWMRLHMVLATGAAMHWGDMFPERH
ncbi:hypothetical protein [Nonomuraea sp. NPDC049784]|uniref:hypothetical protein n=1 Tax=Nonomuraea sp. NPDC049784 TaxID=3154361 RepID=UPI0033C26347